MNDGSNDSTNRYTGWSDLWPPCCICFRKNDWRRNGNFASPYQVKVRRIDDDKHIDWIAVNGGIIEIADNVITIIADSAERERDIDISRAERAKLRAEKEIEEAQDKHLIDQERRAKIALQRAINRINVGTRM